MPILKAPPKLIRNSTIQVRVEEEVDLKLRKDAKFIGASPAFVVAESLKMLFNKDAEFRDWLAQHEHKPAETQAEKSIPGATVQTRPGMRPMFDDGLSCMVQFDVDWVRRFRASWPNKNIAARKKLEALRAYLPVCTREWMDPNEPGQPIEATKDY